MTSTDDYFSPKNSYKPLILNNVQSSIKSPNFEADLLIVKTDNQLIIWIEHQGNETTRGLKSHSHSLLFSAHNRSVM